MKSIERDFENFNLVRSDLKILAGNDKDDRRRF